MLEMYILAINEDSAKSTKALADARVGSTQQPRCVKQEKVPGGLVSLVKRTGWGLGVIEGWVRASQNARWGEQLGAGVHLIC
jgi:hypothetical protein